MGKNYFTFSKFPIWFITIQHGHYIRTTGHGQNYNAIHIDLNIQIRRDKYC